MGTTVGPQALNENTLVAAAKRGQTAAFDELWQSYSQRILLTTYRVTRNHEDAEDALQDSFLRAFLHIQEFDGRARFSTWLTRIAINSSLMILRKKQPSIELPVNDRGDQRGNRAFETIPCHAPDPEALCTQRERERILRRAIGKLRPAIRQVIELQKLREYSLRETAKLMGLSVGATKTRLSRAKTALRKSLKPQIGRCTCRLRISGHQPYPLVSPITRRIPWTPQ